MTTGTTVSLFQIGEEWVLFLFEIEKIWIYSLFEIEKRYLCRRDQ